MRDQLVALQYYNGHEISTLFTLNYGMTTQRVSDSYYDSGLATIRR